ncbi:MAG: hypothetical protein LBQ00_01675 [Syntrophobacterales bacterium]|nr:hypothetical protein [Syntrophobacterales bacterium]
MIKTRKNRPLAMLISVAVMLTMIPMTATSASAAQFPIVAGVHHSLALTGDGTVWAWGDNTYGQLGDKTTTSKNIPVQVKVESIIALAAGAHHSLALTKDGTVWAWGDNAYGQLGDGTTAQKNTPVPVYQPPQKLSLIKPPPFTALAAGADHSLALKEDGTVWAWGRNNNGQLGDGTTAQKNTPVQAQVKGVIALAAGADHSLALLPPQMKCGSGPLLAWGDNAYGQLGDGTTASTNTPVPVKGGNSYFRCP